MNGPYGYGRYDNDPEYVGCPRARTDMTPCIARDGGTALADAVVWEDMPGESVGIFSLGPLRRSRVVPSSICVGCSVKPGVLLQEIGHTPRSNQPRVAANELREQVRRLTEPAEPAQGEHSE